MMVNKTRAKARVRALREVAKEKWEKKSYLPKVDVCGPAAVTLWTGSCNLGPTGYFLHANFPPRYPQEEKRLLKNGGGTVFFRPFLLFVGIFPLQNQKFLDMLQHKCLF